jgi:hypothetical protein
LNWNPTEEQKEIIIKLKAEILKELRYEKISLFTKKEIFLDGRWLEIDSLYVSESIGGEFTNIVINKWKKEKNIEILSKEDEGLVEKLKLLIYFSLNRDINNRLMKEIELKIEAKYIKNGKYRLFWKGEEFELSGINEKNVMWFKNLFEKIIVEEEKDGLLVEREVKVNVSIYVLRDLLVRYLVEIYAKTEEYKLRNLYK